MDLNISVKCRRNKSVYRVGRVTTYKHVPTYTDIHVRNRVQQIAGCVCSLIRSASEAKTIMDKLWRGEQVMVMAPRTEEVYRYKSWRLDAACTAAMTLLAHCGGG